MIDTETEFWFFVRVYLAGVAILALVTLIWAETQRDIIISLGVTDIYLP